MDNEWLKGIAATCESAKAADHDYEFEWYACDAAGNIGVFLTGGDGPVPREVFADKDGFLASAAFLRFVASAVNTDADPDPRLSGFTGQLKADLDEYVKRGLVCFEYAGTAVNGVYRVLFRPRCRLMLGNCSERVRTYIQKIQLVDANFADSDTVDPQKKMDNGDRLRIRT